MTDQYVEFDAEMLKPDSGEGIVQLHNIYLKTTNQSSSTNFLKRIGLDYLTLTVDGSNPSISQNQYRNEKFFLTKVNFYDSANVFQNNYEMTYNNPEILPRSSYFSNPAPEGVFPQNKLGYYYAHDELGYYNGMVGNKTLLPKTSNNLINTQCPNLADRSASLYYAQAGSLQKIKYPTGGESLFSYELPFGGIRTVFSPTLKNISVFYNIDGASSPHTLAAGSSTNKYGDGAFLDYGPLDVRTLSGNSNTFEVTTNTNIPLTFTSNATGSYTHRPIWYFRIKNNTTNQITDCSGNVVPAIGTPYNNLETVTTGSFVLTPGLYSYNLWIDANCADTHNCSGNGLVSNNSFRTRVTFSLPSYEEDFYLPGLRIKTIQTSNNIIQSIPKQKIFYNSMSFP